jgi:hypothetical protein
MKKKREKRTWDAMNTKGWLNHPLGPMGVAPWCLRGGQNHHWKPLLHCPAHPDPPSRHYYPPSSLSKPSTCPAVEASEEKLLVESISFTSSPMAISNHCIPSLHITRLYKPNLPQNPPNHLTPIPKCQKI